MFGFAAFMTGQALAATWRPAWQDRRPIAFCWRLVDRFFAWALFDGTLLSLAGYAIDTLVLLVGSRCLAYRLTRSARWYAISMALRTPACSRWRQLEPFGDAGTVRDT